DANQYDLVTNMMLDRSFIDMPRRVGVRYVEARAGVGVWAPDPVEGTSATVRDPQARVLAIPTSCWVRIATIVRIVRVEPCTVRQHGAMSALEFDVIDERILASAPQQGGGARIDATGEQSHAGDDCITALR